MYLREAWFHLRVLLRNSYFLQLSITAPMVFLALRGLVSANSPRADDFAWVDAIAAGMWSTTAATVGIIGYQRFQGTLEHLVLTSRRLWTVLGPTVFSCPLLGLLGVPLVYGASYLLGTPPRVDQPLILPLGVALLLIACAACSFCLAGLFIITRHALVYEPLIIAPALLIAGVVISPDRLPAVGQVAGLVFPLTGAMQVLHAAVVSNMSAPEVAMWTTQALSTSGVYILAARMVLHVAEAKALRDGTLTLS